MSGDAAGLHEAQRGAVHGPVAVRVHGVLVHGGVPRCRGVSLTFPQAGALDADFLNGIYHPQHTFNFNSGDATSVTTGHALVVLFTEANGGVDMASVVTGMNVPNAGSYAAAKAALGL
jgi:hypothetical protein